MNNKIKSGLNLILRQETVKDYPEVYELVRRAFATKNHHDTADYLNDIREKETFVSELSLVANLDNGKIVGQITLYKTDITTDNEKITQLVLSPISVLPEFWNNGIARAMINFALKKAKDIGYIAVFLQGNPQFYKKFGFEPAYKHNIYHEIDKDRNAEYCMVKILKQGALDGITGMTNYE